MTTRKASRTRSPTKAPRQSEDTLRAVFESMPVGVVVWRSDGHLLLANKRAAEIAGLPSEPELEPSGTAEPYRAAWLACGRALGDESAPFDNVEFELPDGRHRPVEGWAAPVRGADGEIQFAVAVFDDVKAQRGAEALRAGEARVLELIAADVPLLETLDAMARVFEAHAEGLLASILLIEDGVRLRHAAAPSLPETWVHAVDGSPIGPDQGSCGTAAYLKQPVIASDIATDPRWAKYRDRALSFGFRACWAVPIMSPDQEVLGTFALYHTEPREPTPVLLELTRHASHLATVAIQHHRHREALLESEASARLIIDNALDANVLFGTDGTVISWNQRATAIFGWTAQEAVGRQLCGLIIPERFQAVHEHGLRRYLATGEEPIVSQRLEFAALHRDGHEILVELAVTSISRGNRIMFSAFIEDITARKQAEVALKDSQQHLSLVYDHVDDVLFQIQVEPEGYRFVSVNPAFHAATGVDPERIIGKLVHEVIPEPSLTLVLAKYAEAFERHATVRWEETTAYPTGTPHGDVAITPVYDEHGKPKYLIGSVRDMTERKRMEDEVRQLQKLEAIGRLSGGIAHDFNNILCVILGVSNMLLKDFGDPEQHADLEEIVKAGERGAELTRQFLAFSRKQLLQPRVIDLGGVVRGVETMLRRLIREDIPLTTMLDSELWRVKADPGQIEQVVVNLAVNARDAMPHGGTLTVQTANVELDAESVRTHPEAAPGQYAMLAVSDTGHGMSDEVKRRIFEPFFTTKEQGKGTGLGLATVYGIVKQSGGHVWVDSVLGKGTTFRVYLPRSTQKASASGNGEREPRISSGRALADVHVLVVEDEPALRQAIQRMLERLHCRVSVAAGGEEAMAAVAGGLAPDVLLADMVMAGMSGSELAVGLRSSRPDLRVVHMSGYTNEAPAEPYAPGAEALFLQKPFTMRELAATLEQALRSHAPA